MPRATHLQTLGDASSYAAFTNKVQINFFFMVLQFLAYHLRLLFFRHDIFNPIEGDDWTQVIIIAAAAGNNDSAP
jgi:hypothetical protein